MSANPPTKHHFIPAFYLRRWENNATGKLTEYSNPFKRKIAVKPVTAEHTGYEERLYELKGYEAKLAQQVEDTFFKPVDTWASASLDLLEAHGHYAPWDNQSRSAWSRFILSLLLRCPEDIAMFREWWHEDFSATDAEAEARYQEVRGSGDPETFSDYLAGQPLERFTLRWLHSQRSQCSFGTRWGRWSGRAFRCVARCLRWTCAGPCASSA